MFFFRLFVQDIQCLKRTETGMLPTHGNILRAESSCLVVRLRATCALACWLEQQSGAIGSTLMMCFYYIGSEVLLQK